MKKRAVIILPTYNEKNNIIKLIPLLENEIISQIKNYEIYILVADDNSPDGTSIAVKDMMKKWKNIDLNLGEKRGLGAAYMRAMQYSIDALRADVLIGIDSDLSHDPRKIPEFLEKIDNGYDIVIATRYSNGGSIPREWGLHRKFMSIFGNLLIRMVLGRMSVHDWTGAYRAIRKEVFLKERDKIGEMKGYTFLISFLHKAISDGFTVAEVSIQFIDRTEGQSKILPREYIVQALRYIFTARIKELFAKT